MTYLIDSDVLIQAKNYHYGFDFCPGFWDWLVQQHALGKVFSVEKIGNEVQIGNDQLAVWATAQGAAFFQPPTNATLVALKEVAEAIKKYEINETHYPPAALNEFLSSGDYYLISHARAHGHTVVTHEVGNQGSLKRVKIPDACGAVGVPCISPFKMLRDESALLII